MQLVFLVDLSHLSLRRSSYISVAACVRAVLLAAQVKLTALAEALAVSQQAYEQSPHLVGMTTQR